MFPLLMLKDNDNFIMDIWLNLYHISHFQQYFNYMVAVGFIGGGNRRKPLSHNVVWSTPRLIGIQTHNVSGDSH
jgi:hypothetical protein